jgi:fatty-acyl-CoA synthase
MTEPLLTASYRPADTREPVVERTIGDLLRSAAAEVPDRTALVDGSSDGPRRAWTYRELLDGSERVARALLARFRPGERVLVIAPNSAEWVLLQAGAALAGLVLATANPAYREREIEYVLRRSAAAGAVVVDGWRGNPIRETVERLRPGLPALREVLALDRWDELVGPADATVPLPVVRPDDVAQIQFTGGTTGFPKGVLLHHRGIANTPGFVLRNAGMTDGDTWINAMPLFHVGGCVTVGMGIVSLRGTHVVLPEFDPELVLDRIHRERGALTLLVPTMLIRVLERFDPARHDVSSLRIVVSGAAPVPAELIRHLTATLGCGFSNIFGQTEVTGVVTTTRPDDTPEDQSETIGRAVPQVELKIADPETGEILPIGAEGEICARGYQMMQEYLDDPAATATTLRADGWLHTGDLGSMDERGYLRITGRLKDMIIRGGENISPREVEDVLFDRPDVAEVVVLGVPDPEWGEQVAAVVRPAEGCTLSAGELRDHCRERIARFKAPALWFFVDSYPTTPAGKIQKFALRDRILAGELVPAALRPAADRLAHS